MANEREWLPSDLRDAIEEALGRSKAMAPKVGAVLDAVAETLYPTLTGFDVIGARIPIETVEAYGLLIEVDANGRAARVEVPDGAEPCWDTRAS